MSNSFRRYEILLPRQFNDRQSIPEELLVETLMELERRFGAVSSETQIIRGLWTHQGQSYRDELARVFIDVPDTAETQQFFREFKEHLKARFRQIDIWMTSHPIDVIGHILSATNSLSAKLAVLHLSTSKLYLS